MIVREYQMPKVGMGDDESYILVQWLVAEGETFAEGDAIFEVETSKANTEVEATEGAVLAACVALPGASVAAGEVIAILVEAGTRYDPTSVSARVAELTRPQSQSGEGATTADSAITPDLSDERDVVTPRPNDAGPTPAAYLDRADGDTPLRSTPTIAAQQAPEGVRSAVATTPFHSSGALYGLPTKGRPKAPGGPRPPGTPTGLAPLRRPLSRHRRALAQLMTASNAIPQFSVHRELPMLQVLRTVAALRGAGVRATLTDVILRATAAALVLHPEVNATFADDVILLYPRPAIALAADSPSGVLAPVVRGVNDLSWSQLAEERRRLVSGARSGHLLPNDLSGGTFAISNVGALDGDAVVPMLMPPQVAILGLGRVRPGWGQTVATAVLTADHRVLDGADAARFLACLSELMESADVDTAPLGRSDG